jgi:biotin operon repressor
MLDFFNFISVNKMANVSFASRRLGVTRQTIYNHVKAMRKRGYNIKIECGIIYYNT